MEQSFDEAAVWKRVTEQRTEAELSPLYPGLAGALGAALGRQSFFSQLRRREPNLSAELRALGCREITLLRGIYRYLTGKPCPGKKTPAPGKAREVMEALDRSAAALVTLSELSSGEARQGIVEAATLERQQFHLLLELLGKGEGT